MHVRTVLAATALAAATAFSLPALAGNTPKWMKVDQKDKTVTLDVNMGNPKVAGGFNFEGHAHGSMTITVPAGWKVHVKAINVGNLGHSLEIVPAQKNPPQQGIKPAFSSSETAHLKTGIKPKHHGSFTFDAKKAGKYWMMCGVPGHALGGMWDHFVVSKSASSPSVSFSKSS